MIAKAKDYITAGDIFQVVLSQRFETEFHPAALCALSLPAPGEPVALPLLSRLRSVRGHRLQPGNSGPRARRQGVDPAHRRNPRRGETPSEDRALAAELLADPKERAEHLMLLDLGRNDVGRVAEIGSIKVTDQFILEYYSHVMHIVSNVEGKLVQEI